MRRLSLVGFTLLLCLPVAAQTAAHTAAPATAPAADALWSALLEGNRQFVAGTVTYDELKQERKLYAEKQLPPVTLLACTDSRVPPELLFSQSLGAIFVVRNAGNVVDTFGIASIEYAVLHDFTRLLVVLGHEDCGAIESALVPDDPTSPNLLPLMQRIRASFVGIPYNYEDPAVIRRATDANTRASATYLTAQSKIIRDAVRSGKVKVVTAYYSTVTGEVRKVD
jgi:carbonic anhydrase